MNKKTVLGLYKNKLKHNIVGVGVLLITIFLGLKSIFKVFELL